MEENKNTEENKEIEVLNEKTTTIEKVEEKVPDKKDNKNSAVLIFTILGGLVFMLIVVACIVILPGLTGGKNTTKVGNDANDVYSTYKMTGNSLENFDLAFLKLENNGKNQVYSPLSIKYALAMLSEASSGDTKTQITNIIGDYKSKKYPNNDHMSFANAMFIRNTFKDNVNSGYTQTLLDKYNAEVKLDEFKNADNMNKWVSDKTFNLINNLLDNETVSKEDFELINALAIDMNWNYKIQASLDTSDVPNKLYSVYYHHEKYKVDVAYSNNIGVITSEEGFYPLTFNGKENVKSAEIAASFNRYDAVKEIGEDKIREEVGKAYSEWLASEDGQNSLKYGYTEADVNKYLDKYISELNENYNKEASSTDFMLYTDDNVKVFAKDLKEYDGTTLQYVGIMPTNEDLDKYVENVKPEDINKIINNLKTMKKESFKDGVVTLISGRIPMFKYESTLDLMKDFKKLGITDAFDVNKADLSGMLKKTNGAYISSASHKANIEFSNNGIKAAAATQAGGRGAATGGFDYLYEIPVEEIDLTFDKPFMYIIRDKATGEVWFAGTVYEGLQRSVAKSSD